MKPKLRRLSSWKAIIPLFVFLYSAYNIIVTNAANLDFIIAARSNPRFIAMWNFLASPAGQILLLVTSVLWLTYIVLRPEKPAMVNVSAQQPTISSAPQAILPLTAKSQPYIEMLDPSLGGWLDVNDNYFYGIVVPFRNNVESSEALAKNVVAHIVFENIEAEEKINIHYGYWCEENGKYATLGIADTKHLGLVKTSTRSNKTYRSEVLHNKRIVDDKLDYESHGLTDGSWSATIEIACEGFRKSFPPVKFEISDYSPLKLT